MNKDRVMHLSSNSHVLLDSLKNLYNDQPMIPMDAQRQALLYFQGEINLQIYQTDGTDLYV